MGEQIYQHQSHGEKHVSIDRKPIVAGHKTQTTKAARNVRHNGTCAVEGNESDQQTTQTYISQYSTNPGNTMEIKVTNLELSESPPVSYTNVM